MYLLFEIFNYMYKGLSSSKNPFGKLVLIVLDDEFSLKQRPDKL